jgi:hypothetical protein
LDFFFSVPNWSITKAECDRQDNFQYIYSLDFCIKLFLREETYSDASKECRSFRGGNLVKIDRKLKQKEVEKYLGKVIHTMARTNGDLPHNSCRKLQIKELGKNEPLDFFFYLYDD